MLSSCTKMAQPDATYFQVNMKQFLFRGCLGKRLSIRLPSITYHTSPTHNQTTDTLASTWQVQGAVPTSPPVVGESNCLHRLHLPWRSRDLANTQCPLPAVSVFVL